MKATFIEISGFTEVVSDLISDRSYAAIQKQLMDNPDSGDVMKGCGGLRKLRTVDPNRGKGKRGGARVIYLHIPEANKFYMLDIYGKDEQDDLSPQEKKQLSQLAEKLKNEAIVELERPQQENKHDN